MRKYNQKFSVWFQIWVQGGCHRCFTPILVNVDAKKCSVRFFEFWFISPPECSVLPTLLYKNMSSYIVLYWEIVTLKISWKIIISAYQWYFSWNLISLNILVYHIYLQIRVTKLTVLILNIGETVEKRDTILHFGYFRYIRGNIYIYFIYLFILRASYWNNILSLIY